MLFQLFLLENIPTEKSIDTQSFCVNSTNQETYNCIISQYARPAGSHFAMRPAVSHKNGTFQAGRTCRIRARGHRKIKAVFPHPGGFSAYMFLHCRAGRNLHSNYTLKLAKCKERYAFFSRIVQNIDFIFRVFHKKRSAFSTKTGGFLESAPADRRKRECFAKKRFPHGFRVGGVFVENTSAVIRNGFPQC